MFKYHQPVLLPCGDPLLNKDHLSNTTKPIWKIPISDLTPEFLSMLDSLKVTCNFAQMFYSCPGYKQEIHTDGHIINSYGRLNYIYGGTSAKMIWYAPRTPGKETFTPIGTQYLHYKEEQVDVVEESVLSNAVIVNVGHPHRVHNIGFDRRYALSISIGTPVKDMLDYDNLLELFKNCYS